MVYSPLTVLTFLFGGLIVWSVRFLAIYVFTGLACAKGFADLRLGPVGIVPAFVLLATMVALAVNAWLVIAGIGRMRRRAAGVTTPDLDLFIGFTAASVAGLSILAVIWETLPPLVLPLCPAPGAGPTPLS